jgi:hypothetical protein
MIKKLLIGIFTIGILQQSNCDPQVMEQVLSSIPTTTITEGQAASGLKEALMQGATNGSQELAQLNGYFGNSLIKILFPPEAQKVESTLRSLGLNELCDNVILTLNRGAEDAAAEAKPILINSIRQMTVADAMGILFGANDAATEYLKRTTTAELTAKFKPVIQTSLNEVNATKYWSDAVTYYNQIPLVEDLNPDLTGYVTQKALDGLFYKIEQEEIKIRQNPAARVADIVKEVFAYYDANK